MKSRVIISSCLIWLCACDTNNSWRLPAYDPITDTTVQLDSSSLGNNILVVNYWAEWCKPCIEEIPELNHFSQQYQQSVMVTGVNFDNKQGEELKQAMAAVNMQFPALLSRPETVFELPEINGLPTTLLINSKGELINALLGPQTLESLNQALEQAPRRSE